MPWGATRRERSVRSEPWAQRRRTMPRSLRGGIVSGAVTTVVETLGVGKRYGPTVALADVSLTVEAGESHALVGRNGAGKSTLVAILTGLSKPDAGRVTFGGAPAPPLGDREAWRTKVACVY